MMYDCPKFEKCSAPICPLDENWRMRSMLPNERVCLYLREMAKNTDLRHALPEEHVVAIAEAYPEIYRRHYSCRRVILQAAKTGSKLKRPPQRN